MICLFGHKWDGCKCLKCGKTRDEEHDWSGCKCRRCGNRRDEAHNWKGSVCTTCGQTRTIDEITDRAALVEIANNDSNIEVRIKAAEKLKDTSLIIYLNEVRIANKAKWSNDWADHNSVNELTDQILLADIAKNAIHIKASEYAAGKLTDQVLLADVAKNARHIIARVLAAQRLTNQTILAEIIKSRKGITESREGEAGKDIYHDVRAAAARNLTDKALIADVLENAEYFINSYYYYDILLERLKDQT